MEKTYKEKIIDLVRVYQAIQGSPGCDRAYLVCETGICEADIRRSCALLSSRGCLDPALQAKGRYRVVAPLPAFGKDDDGDEYPSPSETIDIHFDGPIIGTAEWVEKDLAPELGRPARNGKPKKPGDGPPPPGDDGLIWEDDLRRHIAGLKKEQARLDLERELIDKKIIEIDKKLWQVRALVDEMLNPPPKAENT
jgi:hypothetical protein